jgi:hypothetical protein
LIRVQSKSEIRVARAGEHNPKTEEPVPADGIEVETEGATHAGLEVVERATPQQATL